jgi:hypothetical protein
MGSHYKSVKSISAENETVRSWCITAGCFSRFTASGNSCLLRARHNLPGSQTKRGPRYANPTKHEELVERRRWA